MRSSVVAVLVGLVSCTPMTNPDPPITTPPQAFLVVAESNVIGTSIQGTTSTSGCAKVTQVRILANDSFLMDARWTTNPTPFEIPASALTNFYGSGIAASITLTAQVACDDGRTNKSQPTGVTFFPVDTVTSATGGAQTLPDAFIAEGGVGGTPTTFIGCIGGQTGTQLARVDTGGGIVQANNALPLPGGCTVNADISDRAQATGTRWLMEKGVGVFAFDRSLAVTASYVGNVQEIGVASDGNAVVMVDTSTKPKVLRLRPNPASGASPIVWTAEFDLGIANAKPLVDPGSHAVFISYFNYDQGSSVGEVILHRINYDDGLMVTGPSGLLIWSQTFPMLEDPVKPLGTFSRDGALLYLPLIAKSTQGDVSTVVYACSTSSSGCMGISRAWTSVPLPGEMQLTLAFNSGNSLAVVGGHQVQFLSASTGNIISNNMAPTRPEGSLVVTGLQPGFSSDFYVLHAPVRNGVVGYPTEIVGLDSPQNGELWRMTYGTGESPSGAMWIAVDEAGGVWLRVGLDLVKPLKNSEYRSVRGVTP